MALPRRCYCYTPTDQVSDWKLRICSPDGKRNAAIIGAAAAALGPGGFRGNRVQLPSAARGRVVACVRSAWRDANPGKPDALMPDGIKP
jgi:hypothetical protein